MASNRITGTPVPGSPNQLASRGGSLPATTVQTFQYDAAGRLVQEDRTGVSSTVWTYDAAGNRIQQATGPQTISYSYDDDNRLLSQTNGSAVTTFTYDANGSMTGRSGPGETYAYGWDTAGRLSSITRNGTSQASFVYDGDGNRVSKTSNGQTTSYINDARGLSQVLQAVSSTGTVSYVGNAQYDSSKPTETAKWGYTLSDAQNSRLLVDNAGNLGHRWEWEPFGRARAEGGSTAAAFSYSGEQRDDETGLVNLRARYYDPGIGRFLSRDSLPGALTMAQSWNRYSYVENDPINATDPSGHKKKTKIKWPMGMDPDDDDNRARKKAKACKNPGQYTGSCKGGPPNAAYAADGEAQHEAKKSGQAAASGNLAAAQAHLQAAAHFSSIAGTAAANTATLQAYASLLAATQSIQAAHRRDNSTANFDSDDGLMLKPTGSPIRPSCGGFPNRGVQAGCRLVDFLIDHGDELVDIVDLVTAYYSEDGGGGGQPDIVHPNGISAIETHLRSWPAFQYEDGTTALDDPGNAAMINRLKNGHRTDWDINFYVHELKEYGKMKRGMSYDEAHAEALRDVGLDPMNRDYLKSLYHPDVIRRYREFFPPGLLGD